MNARTQHFPRETAGLPAARPTDIVTLAAGERFDLRIAPVTKRIGDTTVRMLAYNGSIPGPTLRVRQGSEIELNVVNEGDLEGTVHWHGLRLENRFDGTHETQAPIPVGGSFSYHPHIREDYGQELGLYGNILVDSADPEYWAPVHREVLPLASIAVSDEPAEPSLPFDVLRTDAELSAEREQLDQYLQAPPDKALAFIAETEVEAAEGPYACPMHPDVVADEQGRCPHCGMKLMPLAAIGGASHGHEHHEPHEHGLAHDHDAADGIEWEDDMVEVNRLTTPANMRWKLVDRTTGAENHAIEWRFRVGDRVKIRLVNEMDSDHPMHHPFHIHGAGRFLILARDGRAEDNLVWKDTALVRTGETLDILLDVTNPGRWMAHCHIAEHHEGG
jgi:FtsP/CotA-like multicopper oxidase with cupredoxin domain